MTFFKPGETEEQSRHRRCQAKRWFISRDDAKRALREAKRHHADARHMKNPLSVYLCPFAPKDYPHYHLGHRPTRKDDS